MLFGCLILAPKSSETMDLSVDVTKTENVLKCDVSIGQVELDSQEYFVEKSNLILLFIVFIIHVKFIASEYVETTNLEVQVAKNENCLNCDVTIGKIELDVCKFHAQKSIY